ncbi:putative polysaccharide biosynthesis protein [Fictibacillus gelatini]|uniref:putative polysaccharide biosynthesis protein n=1 Tax=Fictibacillus gelatini TaxID=225985 RepID=UPI00040BA69D|nr:polysaccharide biosynthesis protein [Fictibacillus gelatini]
MNNVSNGMWRGAFLLTVSMLIVKVLSVVYRVPYQNITGDVGFYVYQQVYPLYGIAVTFSFIGFPGALSRFISEKRGTGRADEIKPILQTALKTFFLLGLLAFFVLFFGAAQIARLMGDERLTAPIRTASFLFLIIPFASVIRGLFQGFERMQPTAVSQVIEQVIRVSSILGISWWLTSIGKTIYTVGSGAVAGSVIGAIGGLVSLLLFRRKTDFPFHSLLLPGEFALKMALELIKAGIAFSVSSLLFVIFQLADSFLFINLLVKHGVLLSNARVMKGIFDRGQPLLQLGTVFATSLSLAIVPVIGMARARQDVEKIRQLCGFSLKMAFLLGGAASVGLAIIMEPTNRMLFENAAGSREIAMLCLSVVFASLIMTSTGLLQGLGFSFIPACFVLAGFFVKAAFDILFMPHFFIMGASMATVAASLVVAALNLLYLERKIHFFSKTRFYSIRICGVMIIMAAVTFFFKEGLTALLGTGRMMSAAIAVSSSLVGGIVFILLLLKFHVFSEDELEHIPNVHKLRLLFQRWRERRS